MKKGFRELLLGEHVMGGFWAQGLALSGYPINNSFLQLFSNNLILLLSRRILFVQSVISFKYNRTYVSNKWFISLRCMLK